MLVQAPHIGFTIDFPSRSALEDGSRLRWPSATRAMLYLSSWQGYFQKELQSDPSYHQWWLIIPRSRGSSWCGVVLQQQGKKTGFWRNERTKEIERGVRKLEKEIEGRIDEDNALKSKATQDHHLLLWPSKRLKNHLSCKGGFLE